ncbi:arsenate reductase family protein [Cellulophaga sp. HaHaR_3_176]|uniref:arsenate reductase family protein n=1 Tax=Cellulophaga sp. HaHaR_3_176 TaxID=1942464 RepID=UPI0020B16B23|nr:hypothetical protein [Cellulophaga sp. HaHaR_3_176]
MDDMGVISTDNKKITLYYNSENSIGQQCYAYVQSSDKKVLGIDVSKTNVSGTQWAELAGNLNIPVKDLINVDHADFVKQYGDKKIDLEAHDWMKILEKSPKLIQYPVLIIGENYHQLKSGSDFKKFLDGDSAGLKEA